MTGLSQLAKRRPLTTFFVLAYGLSWALWIPLCVLRDTAPGTYVSIALLIGSTVPSAVAILLTAASLGKSGVRALLKRLLIWRVGLRWYLVLLVPTAIVLVAITAAAVLVGGPTAALAVPVANAVILVVLMTFPGSALGEEIGWRGYALPRLQTHRSALTSSLILGTLHVLWHLPLWLRGLTDYPPLSLYPAFAIQGVAFAVIYTWLYNSTKGSVLLAVLFHTATNAPLTLILLPLGVADFALPFWLMALLTVLAAIIVVAVAGPSQLSRQHRQQQASGIRPESSAQRGHQSTADPATDARR
jgi:membrane protease YdiL (CAAX protease family)